MLAALTHIENELLFKKQIVFLDSFVDTNSTVGTTLTQLAEKEASGKFCDVNLCGVCMCANSMYIQVILWQCMCICK